MSPALSGEDRAIAGLPAEAAPAVQGMFGSQQAVHVVVGALEKQSFAEVPADAACALMGSVVENVAVSVHVLQSF